MIELLLKGLRTLSSIYLINATEKYKTGTFMSARNFIGYNLVNDLIEAIEKTNASSEEDINKLLETSLDRLRKKKNGMPKNYNIDTKIAIVYRIYDMVDEIKSIIKDKENEEEIEEVEL